jgi:hypothetical protein
VMRRETSCMSVGEESLSFSFFRANNINTTAAESHDQTRGKSTASNKRTHRVRCESNFPFESFQPRLCGSDRRQLRGEGVHGMWKQYEEKHLLWQ